MPRLALPLTEHSTPLARITYRERPGAVLHPTPLTGTSEVPGLNLARGCGHRCAFCSLRAAPSWPGDEEVRLFTNIPERLREDLRHQTPRAVFISPATDPFPPQRLVQEEAAGIVAILGAQGVESWLMTRGLIRPSILAQLEPWRDLVRITVGINTLKREVQRLLEAGAAPPTLRLRQIGRLRALGFRVQVALEPLVPELTDTRENLAPLLDALQELGITSVTTSYLFLRTAIAENLQSALPPGMHEPILRAFEDGPILSAPGLAAARYLPRARRQRGYARLISLAASRDIAVTVSALTNPDFAVSSPARSGSRPDLARLFVQPAQQPVS